MHEIQFGFYIFFFISKCSTSWCCLEKWSYLNSLGSETIYKSNFIGFNNKIRNKLKLHTEGNKYRQSMKYKKCMPKKKSINICRSVWKNNKFHIVPFVAYYGFNKFKKLNNKLIQLKYLLSKKKTWSASFKERASYASLAFLYIWFAIYQIRC